MSSRHALIVGINQYPQLNSLRLPATDAEAIAQILQQQGDFHIQRLPQVSKNEQIIVGQKTPVTLAELENALIQLFKPEHNQIPDVALFYFAGHGIRKQKGLDEGFLATSDTNLDNVWGLSLHWLRRLLQESPIKTQIVWLDCCYSGGLLNFQEADPRDAGFARDRCFIAASRAFEVAYEEVAGNHGVLTNVLLQGLDCTHQQQVTNLDLTAFISQQLKTTTQAPVALNLGEAIVLTFNRKQEKTEAIIPTDKPCPYKGLLYFDCNQQDAQNFYGRERLTDELLAKIRQDNFLAVLGASGSGKSSVVRAGLLYQLQRGQKIAGSETWQQRIITPTNEPLLSLAKAFIDTHVSQIEQAKQLNAALELLLTDKGAKGLQALVLAANTKVVLFIDQFEELFSLCREDVQRLQFLNCVLPALDLLGDKFCLIITMRADFFAKCTEQDYCGLAKLIQQHLIAVTPLNEMELTAAIVQPAQALGVSFDAELVSQILKDSQAAAGFLPLLQDVLSQLWQTGLTLKNYAALNGLQGALEKRADAVYQQLSPVQQSAAQAIFLSLVQLGEGTQDTRKRAVKAELISQKHDALLLDAVLLRLANEGLVVTNALDKRDGFDVFKDAWIEIAHEALISHWTLLRQWLSENREFKAWRDRLNLVEKEFQAAKQDKDLLLRGAKLLEAEEKLKLFQADLNDKEIDFIQAGIDEKVRQAKKAKRQLFWLISSLLLFSMILSALAILSFSNAKKAERETQRAEKQQQLAEKQKDLAMAVIWQFTYEVPEALKNIPQTGRLTADILEFNSQKLEEIYALNPNDKSAQREKAVNFGNVSDLYLNLLGNVDKALEYGKKAVDVYQQIATQDPNNASAQNDLSISLEKMGDVHNAIGKTKEALGFYSKEFEILKKLADDDKSNMAAQRDFSVSLNKLGDIYLQLNQTDKALSFYNQALKIGEQIATQDPNNSEAQRDLFISFIKLGSLEKQRKNKVAAKAWFKKALPIAQKLAEDKMNAKAKQDLEWLLNTIKGL